MKKQKFLIRFCLLLSCTVIYSCSSVSYETIYPTLKDGKYDSEFPYKSASEELTKLSEIIYRVSSTAFYRVYIFDDKDNFSLDDLKGKALSKVAKEEAMADNSSAGSATIVYSQNGTVALLTCAHILTFPDTIIAYKADLRGNALNEIASISIKEKQVNYVAGFPEGSIVEILAIDEHSDIAIIGQKYGAQKSMLFPSFKNNLGKAKELEWGTFVYILGYPLNYKMITKAIVSTPNRDAKGSFVVDAVVNPGFSGGLVIAIRDGIPNFEIIGMIKSVPDEAEIYLTPKPAKDNSVYNGFVPYKDDIYVRKRESIKYGIARVVPIEEIIEFVNANKISLNAKGYFVFQQ